MGMRSGVDAKNVWPLADDANHPSRCLAKCNVGERFGRAKKKTPPNHCFNIALQYSNLLLRHLSIISVRFICWIDYSLPLQVSGNVCDVSEAAACPLAWPFPSINNTSIRPRS